MLSAAMLGTWPLWVGFLAFVALMLALDLGVFHRKAHAISLREATVWSAVWIGLAAVFALGVFLLFGPQRGLEFTTGYLIEKALSVDNIFVMVMNCDPFPSRNWRSRAEKSFPVAYPKTCFRASASETFLATLPRMTTSSTS